MARRIFITATDTGAGKTHVTVSLLRELRAAGRDVIGLKPVASGCERHQVNADVAALLKAQGLPEISAAYINRYSFDAPLAPAYAAASQGVAIEPAALVRWCAEKSAAHALSLIEGVGGLMVPLTSGYLVCDWLADMPDCEVLLVIRAHLGGINHALLTLDRLCRMGRAPRWIVVNDADAAGEAMLDQHAAAITARFGATDLICCRHGMSLPAVTRMMDETDFHTAPG